MYATEYHATMDIALPMEDLINVCVTLGTVDRPVAVRIQYNIICFRHCTLQQYLEKEITPVNIMLFVGCNLSFLYQ